VGKETVKPSPQLWCGQEYPQVLLGVVLVVREVRKAYRHPYTYVYWGMGVALDVVREYSLRKLQEKLSSLGFKGDYPTLVKTMVSNRLRARADVYVHIPEAAGVKGIPYLGLSITLPDDAPAELVLSVVEEIIDVLRKYGFH
jgi:hypothetical protein